MPHRDRILMGPGPGNPYPEVIEAFSRPVLGHLDPDFLALLDETNDRLRQVWRTENPLTFPVSGTGSAGMEAAFVNVVAGRPVVVGVNGVFGERMCDVAARCGAEVMRVEAPWGRPIDPSSSSTPTRRPSGHRRGPRRDLHRVRNDIAPLGRGQGRRLLLVDCVTSLGGIPVEVDAWGVDLAYSGTQKCLGVPPGLAPSPCRPGVDAVSSRRPRSWYLDLNMIARYVTGEGARAYHHTAPISMVYALHAGLGVVLDEGLERSWPATPTCGPSSRRARGARASSCSPPRATGCPELTTVWVPDDLPAGMDEAAHPAGAARPLRHRGRRRAR
jgi:alanine-glyoxylate transaminase / serine-glyoxylate transaminase / serine-pyruvate transaminase